MKSDDNNILGITNCREIGRTCACFKVRKAARAITKLYEEVLRPSGLRATQFSLLMATRVMGPVTVLKLAQVMVMDRTTLTRNLEILEKRGLITSKTGEDRREREVSLTTAGMEVLTTAVPLWEEAQNQVEKGLGEERLHNLLGDLSEMISLARK
ncbi:MAG: MarR family winged helix-turn-helix transcriptional regulator [Syntrophales bacterium]|nr:MarR family winged helix-turn-helix transcriptional regulator [Syntrophales bacterium]MDD5640009.1 MarR family winged helix-turn-helix transcriptional regulator [Syntrophales bacterium]